MNLIDAQKLAEAFAPHVGHVIGYNLFEGADAERARLLYVNVSPQVSSTLTWEVTLTIEAYPESKRIFARQAFGCECGIKS